MRGTTLVRYLLTHFINLFSLGNYPPKRPSLIPYIELPPSSTLYDKKISYSSSSTAEIIIATF